MKEGSRARRAALAPIYNKGCFSEFGGARGHGFIKNGAPKSLAHLRLKKLLIFFVAGAQISI
jgi:hypothetical protein